MTEYLRFLFRNKYYILVEVIGISLAVACAVPLLSFFSDKWEIDHGRDYRQVFAASPVGTLETAFLSVYCQARSVAMNNPACFIRDE